MRQEAEQEEDNGRCPKSRGIVLNQEANDAKAISTQAQKDQVIGALQDVMHGMQDIANISHSKDKFTVGGCADLSPNLHISPSTCK